MTTINNILYLGSQGYGSTSLQRLNVLKRLGKQVIVIDISRYLSLLPGWINFFSYRDGYQSIQPLLLRHLKSSINTLNLGVIDLVWIDSGEWLGIECMKLLKASCRAPIFLYSSDDISGDRDKQRFATTRRAISYYDLLSTSRLDCLSELLSLGGRNLHFLWRGYDEIEHVADSQERSSYIHFAGTFIKNSLEGRDGFLRQLIDEGLPLKIWGNRWQRSPHWNHLKSCYQGPALKGKDYARVISQGSINLGFLSHGNRDLFARRSLEITYAGGLLCAERTSEHMLLFEDGHEAVFWSSVEECIEICTHLLKNPRKIEEIRIQGQRKARSLGIGNEDIAKSVLNKLENARK